MASVLIVDDDKMLCEMLQHKISYMGHTSTCCQTLSDGIRCAGEADFDILLLDVRLPDGDGLEAIPRFKSMPSSPEIIIITGEGDPDGAEMAIKTGAWDYIEKPLSTREITLQLNRALQFRREKAAHRSTMLMRREAIIGKDPSLMACLELAAQSANSDANVLIIGETGTGKELFARAIHENSGRSRGNFAVVDCAALPETLVESVLFGHTRGAFTGADETRSGLISESDGGTLFLDEVGELPLKIQKSFLRVLQEKRFRPVGGRTEKQSDFRLVAATNRNLDRMCEAGQFRRDLLFRLRGMVIELPPLRHRAGDIETLMFHFISTVCKRYDIGIKGFSPEFLDAVKSYGWPGNIRELANAIDGAICMAREQSVLYPNHLPTPIRIELARQSVAPKAQANRPFVPSADPGAPYPPLKHLLETCERSYLKNVLDHTGGDIQQICDISGLSRTRLYARLKKYNLTR